MPEREEKLLKEIAKVIGGSVTIPPGHTVAIAPLGHEDFQRIVENRVKQGDPKPVGGFATEETITNNQTGETQPCLIIGFNKDRLVDNELGKGVHIGSIVAHEAIEMNYIISPDDIVQKANAFRKVVEQSEFPEVREFLTENHIKGVIAANRFALRTGGRSVAMAIHRKHFGPGGKNKKLSNLHDRMINIHALRSEARSST